MRRPPGSTPLARARSLRHNQTTPEALLWARLRNRQVAGCKFRRQVWLGPYIVDFFCAEARLVIELDGESHVGVAAEAADAARDAFLVGRGYRVLRFWNHEVTGNIEGVLQAIAAALPSPSRRGATGPSLSPEGRGE